MKKPIFVCLKDKYSIDNVIVEKNEIGIAYNVNGDNYVVNTASLDHPVSIPKNMLFEFDPNKTGDGFSHKICNMCNKLLPVDEFAKNQNGKNNRTVRRPSCNSCRELIDGKDIPSKLKHEWELKKPNLEIWQCPICKKKTIPGLTSKVVLDHNHCNGEPRAWICDSCNTGLGRFKDSVELLQSAIDYLNKVD